MTKETLELLIRHTKGEITLKQAILKAYEKELDKKRALSDSIKKL